MRIGLSLAVLAIGIGLFVYGGTMDMRSSMAMPLVYAGGCTAVVGLAMLLLAWRASRRRAYAAAAQSPDAIARWQVYRSDMAAFHAVDSARAGRLWSLSNALKLPADVPPEGFPVVIGEETLLVGDRFYDLGMRQFGAPGEVTFHEGEPGFLEISCYVETTKAPVIMVLRIPVPPRARNEAAKAYAHLLAQVKPQDRDRLRSTFGDHFEAAEQATDAPHRMQRRRKVVFPLLGLFFLLLIAIILYNMLRPNQYRVPQEPFPTLGNEGAPAYPGVDPLPANGADAPNSAGTSR